MNADLLLRFLKIILISRLQPKLLYIISKFLCAQNHDAYLCLSAFICGSFTRCNKSIKNQRTRKKTNLCYSDFIANVDELLNVHPDRENRLFVYNLVKKMYKHRNELIHEGETSFKELDYNTLLMQLHLCIQTITKQLNKYPKLDQWIELIELIKDEKFDKKLSFQ